MFVSICANLSRASPLSRRCFSYDAFNAIAIKQTIDVLKEEKPLNQPYKSQFARAPQKLGKPGGLAFKPIYPDSLLSPADFTHSARAVAQRAPRRRAIVAPPRPEACYNDVFHQFDIDPLSLCMSPKILYHFVSEMGRIQNRSVTQLTSKTQRRLGRAIRRAKMMGVIPVLSRPKPERRPRLS